METVHNFNWYSISWGWILQINIFIAVALETALILIIKVVNAREKKDKIAISTKLRPN